MKKVLSVILGLGIAASALAATIAFNEYKTVECGVNPRGLAVGDVTGDGTADLVVAGFGSGTYIGFDTPQTVLNPKNSTLQVFSPSASGLVLRDTVHTQFSPRGVAVRNLDGQGGAEVLVTCYDAGKLQTYTWNNGKLHMVEEIPQFTKPVGVVVGSLKAGWPWVVAVANFGADKVSLLKYEANGKLQDRFDVAVGKGPTQVSIGDVNGDGIGDIVVTCIDSNRLDVISLPAGTKDLDLTKASVTASLATAAGSEPADLEVADLDGDGRADIAACNFVANSLVVFLQGVNGVLQAQPVVATSGNRCNGMAVGDLDGDGVKECVVANRDSDKVDVFQADSTMAFGLDGTYLVAGDKDTNLGPIEVAVMDTDLDGGLDIVASHMRSNTLRILTRIVPTPTPTPVPVVVPFSQETTLAYPNPSKGAMKIKFTLAAPTDVTIRIFDLSGQQVWSTVVLASGTKAGNNSIDWSAVNFSQAPVASGTYVLKVTAEGLTATRTIMIVR